MPTKSLLKFYIMASSAHPLISIFGVGFMMYVVVPQWYHTVTTTSVSLHQGVCSKRLSTGRDV